MGTCHGDRYLAATTERQWLPGTCPLAGGLEGLDDAAAGAG